MDKICQKAKRLCLHRCFTRNTQSSETSGRGEVLVFLQPFHWKERSLRDPSNTVLLVKYFFPICPCPAAVLQLLPDWPPAWSGQLQPPHPGHWDMVSLFQGTEAWGSFWSSLKAWEKGKVRMLPGGPRVGTASAERVGVTATWEQPIAQRLRSSRRRWEQWVWIPSGKGGP